MGSWIYVSKTQENTDAAGLDFKVISILFPHQAVGDEGLPNLSVGWEEEAGDLCWGGVSWKCWMGKGGSPSSRSVRGVGTKTRWGDDIKKKACALFCLIGVVSLSWLDPHWLALRVLWLGLLLRQIPRESDSGLIPSLTFLPYGWLSSSYLIQPHPDAGGSQIVPPTHTLLRSSSCIQYALDLSIYRQFWPSS